MSISVFQEKIIKGGCGKFVLFFCGAAMVFGMAFSNCSRGGKISATNLKGEKLKTFATVGDVELPGAMVDKAIDAQIQQSQLPPDILETLPPEYRIQTVSGAVSQSVQEAYTFELAKRMGYKSDDDSIKKSLHYGSEAEFTSFLLETFTKGGQLKPGATLKDLEEFAKPQLKGDTLKDVYVKNIASIEGGLKDPEKRLGIVLGAAQQFVVEKLTAGINPTDDDVKKSFETYQIKRVLLKSTGAATDAAAKAKADKAFADLKANKSFEDVMEAYTEDTSPDPKKKKSENIMNLSLDQLEKLSDFKAILQLQPGSYTEPQKVTEGYAILKYVGKKVDIPKDFDKNKAQYKMQNISQQVQKKFKEEVDKIEKEIKPTFEFKAYEAAYRFQKVGSLPAGPAQDQEYRAIFDLAKSVTNTDDKPDIAAMVQVVTIQHLYDLPGADKAKLKDDRIGALENYLAYSNSWAYRKDVIDYYKEKADKTKAFDQLMIALEKNTKFDAQAQTTFSEMSAKLLELKTAGLVSADQEKQFNTRRDQWRSDKEKYDQEEAALKKQKEEEDKKAAEQAKKAAEEAKKGTSSSATPPKKAPGK